MDVVNGLARSGVHVEHRAIALLMDIRLHGQCLGNLKNVADERIILRRQVVQRLECAFLGQSRGAPVPAAGGL